MKVAVAQAAPVFMDKEKTLEKACRVIREAGDNGAELIAFPEAFIPGYPAYYTVGYETPPHDWTDFMIALQDNSIVIPGDDTEMLAEAARAADAHVVIGCNELDDRKGSRTVYNSLLFISREGKVLGRHRKLMPTYTERSLLGTRRRKRHNHLRHRHRENRGACLLGKSHGSRKGRDGLQRTGLPRGGVAGELEERGR